MGSRRGVDRLEVADAARRVAALEPSVKALVARLEVAIGVAKRAVKIHKAAGVEQVFGVLKEALCCSSGRDMDDVGGDQRVDLIRLMLGIEAEGLRPILLK